MGEGVTTNVAFVKKHETLSSSNQYVCVWPQARAMEEWPMASATAFIIVITCIAIYSVVVSIVIIVFGHGRSELGLYLGQSVILVTRLSFSISLSLSPSLSLSLTLSLSLSFFLPLPLYLSQPFSSCCNSPEHEPSGWSYPAERSCRGGRWSYLCAMRVCVRVRLFIWKPISGHMLPSGTPLQQRG